ncbi:hypothetical protein NDU88_000070 [Pleurodeles waltl]|uniref:Uncharacterized protein n=1 Tax=Pleurodeles waltl TaxID=8319 RepID=A0AAV7R4Q9_PLEWA|nr:hypothetical protein NDU88_000070 [Pleurodeles waltl]
MERSWEIRGFWRTGIPVGFGGWGDPLVLEDAGDPWVLEEGEICGFWRMGEICGFWRTGEIRGFWRTGEIRGFWRTGRSVGSGGRGDLGRSVGFEGRGDLWVLEDGDICWFWRTGEISGFWRTGEIGGFWRTGEIRGFWRTGEIRGDPWVLEDRDTRGFWRMGRSVGFGGCGRSMGFGGRGDLWVLEDGEICVFWRTGEIRGFWRTGEIRGFWRTGRSVGSGGRGDLGRSVGFGGRGDLWVLDHGGYLWVLEDGGDRVILFVLVMSWSSIADMYFDRFVIFVVHARVPSLRQAAWHCALKGADHDDGLSKDRRDADGEDSPKEGLPQYAGKHPRAADEHQGTQEAKHEGQEEDKAQLTVVGFHNCSVPMLDEDTDNRGSEEGEECGEGSQCHAQRITIGEILDLLRDASVSFLIGPVSISALEAVRGI